MRSFWKPGNQISEEHVIFMEKIWVLSETRGERVTPHDPAGMLNKPNSISESLIDCCSEVLEMGLWGSTAVLFSVSIFHREPRWNLNTEKKDFPLKLFFLLLESTIWRFGALINQCSHCTLVSAHAD